MEGLIIGGNSVLQNELDLTIKTENREITVTNSLKQLPLTVHGLIFRGTVYYRKDICVLDLKGSFSGGLMFGGAYYRNFTVLSLRSEKRK